MKHHKKTVIFDFDGTLVDSMNDFADIAADVMFEYFTLDRSTGKQRYLETSGAPFHEQLEVIFPQNLKNKEAAAAFEERKKVTYFDRPLFTDTKETIENLRAQGIKTVISSNNFQDLVDQFVQKSGVTFDLVLGYKPNFAKGEAQFQHISQFFQVARGDMLFVGDSLHDAEHAKRSGVDFVGKLGTFKREQFTTAFPDYQTIEHLSELKKFL